MKRIIIKISGEALKDTNHNIAEESLEKICHNIEKLVTAKKEVVIICGAGNLYRGRESNKQNTVAVDQVGMLGTVMNSLAIKEYLERLKIPVTIRNSFSIEGIANKYNPVEDIKILKDNVLIVSGGTGLPLCTTDKAVIQRAIELECDTILLAKAIDGIYDKDPKKYPDAKKYQTITPQEILNDHLKNDPTKLGIMDFEAEAMLLKYPIKTIVYSSNDIDAINKILHNESVGTIIRSENDC